MLGEWKEKKWVFAACSAVVKTELKAESDEKNIEKMQRLKGSCARREIFVEQEIDIVGLYNSIRATINLTLFVYILSHIYPGLFTPIILGSVHDLTGSLLISRGLSLDNSFSFFIFSHTHTHTHTYICLLIVLYISINICSRYFLIIYLSVSLSLILSFCLYISQNMSMFICLFVLSIYLSIYLSLCLSIPFCSYLSIYLL